uniref:Uncharacterized protein n=1 Tax=Brassica campestris TaxID=3711 RepID=A0A3P5ZLJ6_BRACM|nr:unnamed protein product [Brassica rapa]
MNNISLHQTFSVAGKNVGGGESATQFPAATTGDGYS